MGVFSSSSSSIEVFFVSCLYAIIENPPKREYGLNVREVMLGGYRFGEHQCINDEKSWQTVCAFCHFLLDRMTYLYKSNHLI